MKEPVEKLQECYQEYLDKGFSHGYNKVNLKDTYQQGLQVLDELKQIRNSKGRTERYLRIKFVRPYGSYDTTLLLTWLLRSLYEDDSYTYSYNYIAGWDNRLAGYDFNVCKMYTKDEIGQFINRAINIITNYEEATISPISIEQQLEAPKISIKGQNDINTRGQLKKDLILQVYNILKDYFNEEDQPKLEYLLSTFENIEPKLIFKGQGNKLADVFRKLIENQIIIGIQKDQLQKWIVQNFSYTIKHQIYEFKIFTLHKYISKNGYESKNPIIYVKDGKIYGN